MQIWSLERSLVKRGDPVYNLLCKLEQSLWRTVWKFFKKLKIDLPYDAAIPVLGIYPDKTLNSKRYMDSSVHSSTVYSNHGVEVTEMSIDWWIDKEDAEYYSATKRKEIMPFAATWMDLEIIMLSEVKSDKNKYHMISLIWNLYHIWNLKKLNKCTYLQNRDRLMGRK